MNKQVISLVFAVLLYNFFFFRMPWGISFFVLILGLNVLLLLHHKPISRLALFFSGMSCVSSLLSALTGNSFLQMLDVGTAWSGLFLAMLFTLGNVQPVVSLSTLVFGPLLTFVQYLACILAKIVRTDGPKMPPGMGALIRGLLLGAPVIFVLYLLLASADPIFSKYSHDLLKQIGPRTFHSLMVIALLIPFITSWMVRVFTYPQGLAKVLGGLTKEAGVVVGAVTLLFLGFLIIQFQYLFHTVSEGELIKLGVATYSEYVRKGFLELLLASSIAYGVVAVTVWLNHHRKEGQDKIVTWLNTALIIEVFALIASNAQRVYLYQALHGLTRIRIFGSFFLLWLALMLVSLLIKNWKHAKVRSGLAFTEIVVTLVVLALSHVVNVDSLIATKVPPTVNKEIDYVYISRLSSDGVEGWLPAIKNAQKIIEMGEEKGKNIDQELNRKLFYAGMTLNNIKNSVEALRLIYGKTNWPWQAYNYREYTAWLYIQKHPEFGNLPTLLDRVRKVQNTVSQQVQSTTQYDRSLDHPLLGN